MADKVTGRSLRRDISAFVRLKKASFSQKNYYRQEEILDRAENILNQYRHGQLQIEPKDYPVLAEYINKFAYYHKDELLDKLQSKADFDIQIYLEDKSKTLWQRLFPKKENNLLQASQMKSAIKKYTLMLNKASKNSFYNPNLAIKIEQLSDEAERNVNAFLIGKLDIAPQDLDIFAQYIKVFNTSIYERSPAEQALDKIETLKQSDTIIANTQAEHKTTFLRKPVITSFAFRRKKTNLWTRFNNKVQSLWSLYKPTSAKIRSIKTSGNTIWRRIKVAAVTIAVVVTSAFSLKSGVGTHEQINITPNNNTSLPANNSPKEMTDDQKTLQFSQVQKLQNEKEARIWQNYYDTTIEIIAPTLKIDKQELYNKIKSQLDKGIFVLPEGVTTEKVALNYVMFKAYGLPSSLENAITSNKKLSNEQQLNFASDAGIKQTDIKQIALKKYGKLSSYSAYDHAPKKLQTQHVNNLKELRQMRKQAVQHI